MKVLVTGGAGFIGSHTVDLLLERGYEVRILDNLQPLVHPRGKPSWVPREAEFVLGDVTRRDDLEPALRDVDYVVHLAAYQDYMPDFSNFIRVNAESTALIFELIVAATLAHRPLRVRKIVFASSQSVCGEGLYACPAHGLLSPPPRPVEQLRRGDWELHCPHCGSPMEPRPIPETVVNPGTAYAISKATIELLADRLGRRYEIPTVCMRYTYVQGPRNSFYNAYSGIARRFALRLLQGLPPVCFEDGRQLRDYINVRDVARANVLVMEDERADYGVFNAGGMRAVRVLEFARIMIDEFGGGLDPLVPGEFRLGDTRHTVSDVSRLEALGWRARVPVEESVREYIAWMREQRASDEFIREADRVMREQQVVQSVAGELR